MVRQCGESSIDFKEIATIVGRCHYGSGCEREQGGGQVQEATTMGLDYVAWRCIVDDYFGWKVDDVHESKVGCAWVEQQWKGDFIFRSPEGRASGEKRTRMETLILIGITQMEPSVTQRKSHKEN